MSGIQRFLLFFLWLVTSVSGAADHRNDPHYTQSGFFDVHLCNWPNRSPFYMVLYSTEMFDMVRSVEIFAPDNKIIGELDIGRFKLIKRENRPEKRVFISQLEAPADGIDGWFSARIKLADGEVLEAKDFVIHYIVPKAEATEPVNNAADIAVPSELKWQAIEEAAFYQVFIRDQWDDGKLIYTSKMLSQPVLKLPAGLLEEGGYYSWKIHARDVNEHVQLGDFNMGSNSEWFEFAISQE